MSPTHANKKGAREPLEDIGSTEICKSLADRVETRVDGRWPSSWGPSRHFPPKIRSDVALGGGDRSFGAMRGFYVVRKSTRPDPLIHSSNGAADINCDAVGMG